MLNKLLFIRITLIRNKKPNFRLPLPIPIWVLEEIFESLIEIFILIGLFIPERSRALRSILVLFEDFLVELTNYPGLDLVDVTTPEAVVKIKLL